VLSRALRTPLWWQVSVAASAAVVGYGLTLLLNLRERPFLLPMLAVLVAALRGGFTAGLLCGAFTVLLANYSIMEPHGQFGLRSMTDAYELGVFGLTAAIISLLSARRRRAQVTLEATLSSIGDGVIVTTEDGRVSFLNNVAEDLTGWTVDDALGRPVGEVFVVLAEETRQPAPSPVDRALREGVVVGLGNHTVLTSRDGSERPILDSAAPIRDATGRTIGAVLVFRDASLQRQADARLRQQALEREGLLEREQNARADAERANRLKDEFLATLSHELRTPLNAVLGWSHMLTRRQLTSEQQKQALDAIHRNAQAQARLVDDVLDLSRIVTGRLALTSEVVDVSEVARLTTESFTPAVLGKRQALGLELEPGAHVRGDPHRLRQILWNLLSNATKFTPDGGTITVRVATVRDRVELSVADSGQGIDASFLPFVFDRFRQADSSSTRGHGGLGLGLALVRHLAEAHGGTASAASEGLGQGATICISLPAYAPRTDRADARADDRAERPSEPPPAL
jgi:PAS domain S-box-containing protein